MGACDSGVTKRQQDSEQALTCLAMHGPKQRRRCPQRHGEAQVLDLLQEPHLHECAREHGRRQEVLQTRRDVDVREGRLPADDK